MSSVTQICNDTSEAIDLLDSHGLFLKPVAKISISVQLPPAKPGCPHNISNWELMDKIKKIILPDEFLVIKVTKSMAELVRFEAELESRHMIKHITTKLNESCIKLSGIAESLKMRSCEAKVIFAVRHDWEAFFRDAKNMNEMKPGERPDTLHFHNLPCRWFSTERQGDCSDRPSEFILRKVFETFGSVRCTDIPMLDPYSGSNGRLNTFRKFGQQLTFEAFVQFKDYISFVRAMSALRGMKLMYRADKNSKAYVAVIDVTFDTTKHLSDKNIRRRRLERERMQRLEKEEQERIRKEREEDERRKEEERQQIAEKKRQKEERRKEREEKRRKRKLERKKLEAEARMQLKIAMEERRLLIAQRKLESIRLLTDLFGRIKIIKQKEDVENKLRELQLERIRQLEADKRRQIAEEEKRQNDAQDQKIVLEKREAELRATLMATLRRQDELKKDELREKLRMQLAKKRRKLKSVVERGGDSSRGVTLAQQLVRRSKRALSVRPDSMHADRMERAAFREKMSARMTEHRYDYYHRAGPMGPPQFRPYFHPHYNPKFVNRPRFPARSFHTYHVNPNFPPLNHNFDRYPHRPAAQWRAQLKPGNDLDDVSDDGDDSDNKTSPTKLQSKVVKKRPAKPCTDCGMPNCFYTQHPHVADEAGGALRSRSRSPLGEVRPIVEESGGSGDENENDKEIPTSLTQ